MGFVTTSFCIIFCIITFTRESRSMKTEDGIGKFQYCSETEDPAAIRNHHCPSGKFKFASQYQENCVCVQGIWKITYSLHAGFDFVYGTNVRLDCFQLRGNVEQFEFLGSGVPSSSPFMEQAEFTNEISNPSVLVDLTQHSAFTDPKSKSMHPRCHRISIHKTGIVIGRTKISGPKNEATCFQLKFPGNLRIMYEKMDTISAKRPKISRKRRESEPEDPVAPMEDCKKNISQVYIDPRYTAGEKDSIINDETIRILTDDTTRLLYNERLNITDDCQFKLIKRMAKNLRKLCPINNKRIYFAAIRMFKHLVLLDKVQNPRKVQLEKKCEWVEGLLTNCSRNDSALIKGFDYRNVYHCYNKTVNISAAYKKILGAVPPCKCQRLAVTLKNETSPLFARNPNYSSPDSLNLGLKIRDFPVETLWKTFLINYHGCEEGLTGNNTFGIDQLYYQVRQLFSPRIISRWENPGNSLEGYSVVFGRSNLMKFMSELDICLEYYHVTGPMRWWLYAPKNVNRTKRSLGDKQDANLETEAPDTFLQSPKSYHCLL